VSHHSAYFSCPDASSSVISFSDRFASFHLMLVGRGDGGGGGDEVLHDLQF